MAYGRELFRRGGKGGWNYRVTHPTGGYAELSWNDFELEAFKRDVTHELSFEIQRIIAKAVKRVLEEILAYAKRMTALTSNLVYERIARSLSIEHIETGRHMTGQKEFNFQIVSDGAPASRGADLAVLYQKSRSEWDYHPLFTQEKKPFVVSSNAFLRATGETVFPAIGFAESPGISYSNERMRPFNWDDEVDWHIESEINEELVDLMQRRYG